MSVLARRHVPLIRFPNRRSTNTKGFTLHSANLKIEKSTAVPVIRVINKPPLNVIELEMINLGGAYDPPAARKPAAKNSSEQ